jgi:hypothetical protein
MATLTLDDIVEQQQGTNERLDGVDNRFVQFFQQVAKDKMALMEMMRELTSPAPISDSTPPGVKPEEEGGGLLAALFGGVGGLAALAGTLLAVGLNSVGAVIGIDKMGAGLKSLGTKFGGWIGDMGTKLKDFGSKTLAGMTEKIKSLSASAGEKVDTLKKGASEKLGAAKKGIVDFITQKTKSGRALGETFKDAGGRLQTIVKNADGKLVPQFAKAGAVVGGAAPTTITGAIGRRFSQAATAFNETKVGKFAAQNADKLKNVGGKVIKGASRVAVPLAVATAGYEGFKLGTEDPNLSTAGKIAVGAAGATSSLVGGFIDFAKLITVDAFIEAGQKLGLVPEKGFAQDLQEYSVQKQLDKGIRFVRDYDAVRPAATDEIGRQTMASVGKSGSIVVTNVNNVNAPTTTQNNVSSTSSDQMSSPVSGNGSRSDAYAMG